MALDLDDERLELIAALARAMKGSEAARGKLLGVKGVALKAATQADRAVRTAPTLPAIQRYTGVLYDALDAASLSTLERRRLDRSVLIVSGLWGIVAPSDLIPSYKLKMGASLAGTGKLSTWWRPVISEVLADRAARSSQVWNLLPIEHEAAWTAPEGLSQVTVKFLDTRADGSRTVVSHANKALKGALVRFLVANPAAGPSQLARWKHPWGYRLDRSLTERKGDRTTLSLVSLRPRGAKAT